MGFGFYLLRIPYNIFQEMVDEIRAGPLVEDSSCFLNKTGLYLSFHAFPILDYSYCLAALGICCQTQTCGDYFVFL